MGTPVQSGSPGPVDIHYATVFDGKTPVLCGVNSVPKPAASEWRYVSCRACLVLGARTSPEAAARLRKIEAEDPTGETGRPWRPEGWRSLAGGGTPGHLRDRVCPCEHCTRDGQHEPMCFVHDEADPRCNCPLSQADGPKSK